MRNRPLYTRSICALGERRQDLPTVVGYMAMRGAQMDEEGKDEANLNRRQVLTRAGGGLLAASALPAFLAACGSDSGGSTATGSATAAAAGGPPAASEVTGDLVIYSYPGWYG